MSRYALLLALCLSACSQDSQPPPRNLQDACVMKAERPSWFRSMERVERQWGAPVEVQLATLYQESTFRPKARTPRKYFLGFIPAGRVSTAYGYAQAIDGTWDWYQRETGKNRARRDRFGDATDFMGWYMARSTEQNGIAPGDAYNQYLAYHEGHAGFRRGTYRRKAWLQNTAARVQSRAARYAEQLRGCP